VASSQGSGGAEPLERFTLLEKIGRGGMGVVWKARDEETGAIVAFKLLHAAYADQPDYVARFERELELAQRIHSDHVVEVLGYGVRDGTPYLALQYIDGPSLRQALTEHGPYSWDETRALLVQVASGLSDAHAAGVVHRDVKPSNILIGSDGVAKLADFGIARGVDLTRVTGTSTLLGTPAYLAPEGAKDERADIYSLGIVAYELLAGVPPFEGETFSDVLLAHLRMPPDLERLPEAARSIVGWLLAKDPNARPQNVGELLAVLEGKTNAPPLIAAETGLAPASADMLTRSIGPNVEPSDDWRDRARRRRRVLAALLVSAFVVVLAAGAVWGATGGLGVGPRPVSSGLIAAGGPRRPALRWLFHWWDQLRPSRQPGSLWARQAQRQPPT
jgi:serine/threonine-protein kinase